MNENDLSYLIRGAAFKVHPALGPGLLESVYEVINFNFVSLKYVIVRIGSVKNFV